MCVFSPAPIIKNKRGKILGFRRKNGYVEVNLECNCGNSWWTRPTHIIDRGTWCPKCGGTQKKTIEDMQKLALNILHGGKCLSKEYKDAKSPLLWECGLCKFTFKKNSHYLNRSYCGGCPICLSIKKMKKSHIKLLNYLKSTKNVKSIQDIIIDIKYNNDKIVAIMRILERKELIEKFKYYFKDSRRHGYKISSKGLRILELYEVLKK